MGIFKNVYYVLEKLETVGIISRVPLTIKLCGSQFLRKQIIVFDILRNNAPLSEMESVK